MIESLVLTTLFACIAFGLLFFGRNLRKSWRAIAYGVAALSVLAASLSMMLFIFSGMCGRYDYTEMASPDGEYIARVSEEDCGAMDSFHTRVNLWKRGTVHCSTHGKATAVFNSSDAPNFVELKWLGPNSLTILYPDRPSGPEKFSCVRQMQSVQITCVPYTADNKQPPVQEKPIVQHWFR
jgi:hypothetical protein